MGDPTWYRKAFLYAGIANEIASNYTTFQWIGDMMRRNTGLDSIYLLTHNSSSVNPSDITTQLNAGRGIFLWRGSWVGGIGNEVAGQCNNGARTPITLTVTCGTGSFGRKRHLGIGIVGPGRFSGIAEGRRDGSRHGDLGNAPPGKPLCHRRPRLRDCRDFRRSTFRIA